MALTSRQPSGAPNHPLSISPVYSDRDQRSIAASVDSDIFEVYAAGSFSGVRASSALNKERASRLKHRKERELDPKMGKSPWEVVHVSVRGFDSILRIVELDSEISTGPWEIIRSHAEDDDRELEMVELEKELKEFTVYDILHIRQQRYQGFELLIAQSCVPELQKALAKHYHVQRQIDPTIPDAREVNVFGLVTATEGAYNRFINTAVDVISNRWSEAGHFYLREAESHGLGTRLETALQYDRYDKNVLHEDEKCISDNDDYLTIKF